MRDVKDVFGDVLLAWLGPSDWVAVAVDYSPVEVFLLLCAEIGEHLPAHQLPFSIQEI